MKRYDFFSQHGLKIDFQEESFLKIRGIFLSTYIHFGSSKLPTLTAGFYGFNAMQHDGKGAWS